MKTFPKLVYILGIFAVICIGIVIYVVLQKPPEQKTTQIAFPTVEQIANPSSAYVRPTSPSQAAYDVAKNFYTSYISSPVSPAASKEYLNSPYLTDSYKKRITLLQSISPDPKYDPIFCEANKTKNIAFSDIKYNDAQDRADIIIHQFNGDGKDLYHVSLKKTNMIWQVNEIECL